MHNPCTGPWGPPQMALSDVLHQAAPLSTWEVHRPAQSNHRNSGMRTKEVQDTEMSCPAKLNFQRCVFLASVTVPIRNTAHSLLHRS